MATSPTCTSCGRRSLRHRKRTDDYVCRKCGAIHLAEDVQADELADVQLRRLRPASRLPSRRPRGGAVRQREIADALAGMEAACKAMDVAVERVLKQHDPLGCLPFALALATGVIAAAVAVRSMRWYLAALVSVGAAAAMSVVLMIFRIVSFSRQHPLLAEMFKLQHSRADEDAEFNRIELGEAIVHRYLPPEQGEPLLERLEDAKVRTAMLLGLSGLEFAGDEPWPRDRSGA